jgi:hypothetical protein
MLRLAFSPFIRDDPASADRNCRRPRPGFGPVPVTQGNIVVRDN